MNEKILNKKLGIIAAAIGILALCVGLVVWVSSGPVMQRPMEAQSGAWPAGMVLPRLLKFREFSSSTHTGGPFYFRKEDAPLSGKWVVRDGGKKSYRFLFVLHNDRNEPLWMHIGSNDQLPPPSKPEPNATVVEFPVTLLQLPGPYYVRAAVLDSAGNPVQLASEIVFERPGK